MNTKISYLYRDASNYKQHEEVVIKGELHFYEISPLLEHSIGDAGGFIPYDLGLEDLQWRFKDIDPTTQNEDDHIWHELESIKFTNEPPTATVTADDIRKKLQIIKGNGFWNETAAMERLGYF